MTTTRWARCRGRSAATWWLSAPTAAAYTSGTWEQIRNWTFWVVITTGERRKRVLLKDPCGANFSCFRFNMHPNMITISLYKNIIMKKTNSGSYSILSYPEKGVWCDFFRTEEFYHAPKQCKSINCWFITETIFTSQEKLKWTLGIFALRV